MKRCCPECFGDPGLKKYIFPSLGPENGTCDYCGSDDVALLLPNRLASYFESLVGVYEPSAGGKLLVEWMKVDWALFSHPMMDVSHAKELLSDILDDGNLVRKPYIPSPAYKSDGLLKWETLKNEMMYKNRWFLDVAVDAERLNQLFSYLIADDLPDNWYRARLSSGDDVFPIGEMGAPPSRKTSHGRANPAGIPYLYLGSLEQTAVSEIRPHTGDRACVAQFSVQNPISAVDLREPKRRVSPFLLTDAGEIGQLRADIPFLEKLGEELTRPVLPSGAAIDYIPSQYLCELIKKSNYDGVVYRSSVSEGMNLALFDPGKAKGIDVRSFVVSQVSVNIEELHG